MKVIIVSKTDIASMNIFNHLLELGSWEEKGEFLESPLYLFEDYLMATIPDEHIYHDNVDDELIQVTKERPECLIYASRHRSESGKRSLTVHPVGNFNKAEFGGRLGALVPSSPQLMTQALRLLKKKARDLDYSVSFEATHHGPFLKTPTFFIEIGSDEAAWKDKEAAGVIAETVLEIHNPDYPVGIGIGGGHYMPRITDVALERKVSFGHMIATYALPDITPEMGQQVISKSEGAGFAYFHKKHLAAGQYAQFSGMFTSLGLKVVKSGDLDMLVDGKKA